MKEGQKQAQEAQKRALERLDQQFRGFEEVKKHAQEKTHQQFQEMKGGQKQVQERVDTNNAEITNAVVVAKENVSAMEASLSKVERISNESLNSNSGVDRIQQKLDENPSKASRQLREQGRQIGQNNNRSSSVHESSLGLAGDVTEGGVKFLRPRTDKKLDAELAKKANVTRGSTDNCGVKVPKKRSKLDPKNIRDKDLRTMVKQSNPQIWKVYVKMKEIVRMRKSKKRRVRFKWRSQVRTQLLDKSQQVSNTIDKMKEIAKIR
jgi:hypothetical protein